MTIWYILCLFGTFFHVLVSCTKKNLATLIEIKRFGACLQSQEQKATPVRPAAPHHVAVDLEKDWRRTNKNLTWTQSYQTQVAHICTKILQICVKVLKI
jgi:hypothetical protein